MRKIGAILLFLALVYPFGLKTYRIIHWTIFQKEIASTLCVNKDKPQLKCNGKCQLVKALQSVDQHSKRSSNDIKAISRIEIPPFMLSFFPALCQMYSFGLTPNQCLYKTWFTEGSTSSIFHPPSPRILIFT